MVLWKKAASTGKPFHEVSLSAPCDRLPSFRRLWSALPAGRGVVGSCVDLWPSLSRHHWLGLYQLAAVLPLGMSGILVPQLAVVVEAARKLSPAPCRTRFPTAVRSRQKDARCLLLHSVHRLSCPFYPYLAAYVSCFSRHLWLLLNRIHTTSILAATLATSPH